MQSFSPKTKRNHQGLKGKSWRRRRKSTAKTAALKKLRFIERELQKITTHRLKICRVKCVGRRGKPCGNQLGIITFPTVS